MKNLFSAALLITACLFAWTNTDGAERPLPKDPAYIVKKLDNGITYYIRANKKPEQRAELRLVVNAGSLQEDDDQLGLAHFIEHMAFNGTNNFTKNELVDYLQSVGMRFGPHLNAYTSFAETVYQLRVPTDDPEILSTAMTILEDWAHGLTLVGEEIDKERGVVLEEWRSRLGPGERVFRKQMEVVFHNARHKDRLPIGTPEILENAPHDVFKRFYEDWYRPDLMAVVVVGDVDVAAVEKMIVKHFSKIKGPENPRPHQEYSLPGHKETLFSIVTDPELTTSRINVSFKHGDMPVNNITDFRRRVIEILNQNLFNDRLSELVREENPPYLGAFASLGASVRNANNYNLGVTPKEGAFEEGFTTLLREMRRLKEFGFTQSELDRGRVEYMTFLERAYNERDKTNSRAYVNTAVQHYLTGAPLMEIEQLKPLFEEILPTITLEEVNTASAGWITDENRVVTVSMPEKEGLTPPTQAEIMSWWDKAAKLPIEPYKDNVGEGPIVEKEPTPGKVVSEKKHEAIDTTEWTLSNGVRVVIKETDFKNDQILFRATSPGGSSLMPDDKVDNASMGTIMVGMSGLGKFDADQWRKLLADKNVSVSPSIGGTSEGFTGSSTPKDLETALQLVYLNFTAPRITEKAWNSTIARYEQFLINQNKQPGTVFNRKFTAAYYNNHPRMKPLEAEDLRKMDRKMAEDFFKDRFADASDFTFFFVGNINRETAKPLIEKWLGGLPSINREEKWVDNKVVPVTGKHELVVNKGMEPRASVTLRFHGPAEWSIWNSYVVSSVTEALRIRFIKLLREEMGGVYSVGVQGSLSRIPRNYFTNVISFTCDPERKEELIAAVYTELERLAKEGFAAETVDKVRNAQKRAYEEAMEQNGRWLGYISSYYSNELDPNMIVDIPKRYDSLNGDHLKQAVTDFYLVDNRFKAILLPEVSEGEKSGE